MPLVWTTDKIIAGKYRVKKPIPVEMHEMDGNEYTYTGMRIGGWNYYGIDYEYDTTDDFVIEYIEKHLPDFMEYLEEIK